MSESSEPYYREANRTCRKEEAFDPLGSRLSIVPVIPRLRNAQADRVLGGLSNSASAIPVFSASMA